MAAEMVRFDQGEMDLSPDPVSGCLGHGCFRKFKFKHEDSPKCPTCAEVDENAEHVFFTCPRFSDIRDTGETELGRKVSPENLVETMLSSQTAWDATSNFAAEVMKELRNEERTRMVAV
ncbi:uncharacterized protein LOC107044633 [Diachasma alloeum]|uniref:uncharacterized protein LOC107044633 n=1 Tax=Diachasma alloeum TaxID=454923 RepID=UPI0007382C6E|nr:uncharacterized protein LOC107044633 [Diachasma alloeum]